MKFSVKGSFKYEGNPEGSTLKIASVASFRLFLKAFLAVMTTESHGYHAKSVAYFID